MEQVPRADGPPVGERSVEQATRQQKGLDAVVGGLSTGAGPVAFAVPQRLAVVDSTNRYLARLVNDGLPTGAEVPEGYAVVADHQTDGKGRLGRAWVTPPGTSVLCSILLRADLAPDQLHLAASVVALAALRACRATAGVDLSLKWPNDLISSSSAGGPAGTALEPVPAGRGVARKLAGILSEVVAPRRSDEPARVPARRWPAVVVGIGINVNWPAGWPPEDSRDPDLAAMAQGATALNRLVGHEIDRDELVRRLLEEAGVLNGALFSPEGRHGLASQYRRACATIGREVRVELGDESVTGTALDVDDAGCLLVSTGACIRTISAGDVVHVR